MMLQDRSLPGLVTLRTSPRYNPFDYVSRVVVT